MYVVATYDAFQAVLGFLKAALEKASGQKEDSLVASRTSVIREQGPAKIIEKFLQL